MGFLLRGLCPLVPPFDTIKNVRAGRFATLPQNERPMLIPIHQSIQKNT